METDEENERLLSRCLLFFDEMKEVRTMQHIRIVAKKHDIRVVFKDIFLDIPAVITKIDGIDPAEGGSKECLNRPGEGILNY